MTDLHALIYWKMGPSGGGAPTIRLPRWLHALHRAASAEVSARLRQAETMPVEATPRDRKRSERSRLIREAQRHQRMLDAVVWDVSRAIRNETG